MSDVFDERVEDAFYQAIDLEESQRAAFLAQLAEEDPKLHEQVVSLVHARDRADRFLDDSLAEEIREWVTPLRESVRDAIEREMPELLLPLSWSDGEAPEGLTPDQIGPYRVQRLLGRGGMGQVFLVLQSDGEVGREVALKLVKSSRMTEEGLRMFRAEQQTLAGLNHRNIAHVYDFGKTETGVPYFTMEYVAGQTLSRFVLEHKPTLDQRLDLFVQICDGVAHAHRHGVLHRDLKPSNVLVHESDDQYEVKVIDFGIARTLGDEVVEQAPVWGSPRFMSPERLLTGSADVTSDIFSLGAMFYELLCGLPAQDLPNHVADQQELKTILASQVPIPLSQRFRGELGDLAQGVAPRALHRLSPDLDAVLAKCLAPNPARRYLSVSDLTNDLVDLRNNMPVRARPQTLGYILGKFVRRRAREVWLVAALVLLSTGLLVRSYVQERRARAEAERALQEAEASLATLELILSAPHPHREGGETRLIDALRVIDDSLVNIPQPLVKARVSLILANTFDVLGFDELSLDHSRNALDQYRTILGDHHPRTLTADYQMGKILFNQQRFGEAADHLNALLDRQRNVFSDHDQRVLTVEIIQALARGELGQRIDADIQRIYMRFNQFTEEPSPVYITALLELGKYFVDHSELTKALTIYGYSTDKLLDLRGKQNRQTLMAMHAQAVVLFYLSRFHEAELLFQKVVNQRILLGSGSDDLLDSQLWLARTFHSLQKHDDAILLFSAVLSIQNRTRESTHERTMWVRNNLALVYRDCGDYDLALDSFSRLNDDYQQSGQAYQREHLKVLHNLGDIYTILGDYRQAQLYFEEALHYKLDFDNGEEENTVHLSMAGLGETLIYQQEYEEARRILDQVVALAELYQSERVAHMLIYRGFNAFAGWCLGEPGAERRFRSIMTQLEAQPLFHAELVQLAENHRCSD